jgi:Flp pilus assembly protein TadB
MNEFFLKMFGVYVGCSVIRFYFRQNFITKGHMTKIVSVYFFVQLAVWIFVSNFYLQWVFCFAPAGGLIVFFIFYLQYLETQFRYDFPDILTCVILQMKMGHGFRKSFQSVLTHAPQKYVASMLYIFENVVFSPHQSDKKMTGTSHFLSEIISEFKKVDQSAHKSIEKLENFRRRLLLLNNFRRKSGRIRGQVQLQAGILFVIYAMSFAFVAFAFSLKGLEGMLLVSFTLFTAGMLLIFYLGKDVKWKI